VWDISLESATPLYRAGGGVTLTTWSPDERNVFAATPSSLFRWDLKWCSCQQISCHYTKRKLRLLLVSRVSWACGKRNVEVTPQKFFSAKVWFPLGAISIHPLMQSSCDSAHNLLLLMKQAQSRKSSKYKRITVTPVDASRLSHPLKGFSITMKQRTYKSTQEIKN